MARRSDTNEKVEFRIVDLCDDFEEYLDRYDKQTPFDRADQLGTHRRTIELRRELGSVDAAVHDPAFLESLYATLTAWNMNQRAAKLVDPPQFAEALQKVAPRLAPFEKDTIENVDGPSMASRLCEWMNELDTSPVMNRVVTATKTLHHLLPDLVPPMDRAYTRVFFHWHMQQFQNNPKGFLLDTYPRFVRIAKTVKPARFVGDGWRTSRTKLLDNAIVAYCGGKSLSLD